jgi:hypothetical protein
MLEYVTYIAYLSKIFGRGTIGIGGLDYTDFDLAFEPC